MKGTCHQGISEAALFALSGGMKIPKTVAVLKGMIPIAIDISVRILGQALVLAYAPVCLYVATLKFLMSMVMALVLSFYFLGADDIVDKVKLFFLNGIGGMISPVPNFDTKAFSKGALRKYYAINRILLSSILLWNFAWLFL